MQNLSEKYLLQIEPRNNKSDAPIDDDLTKKMENLLSSAIEGVYQNDRFRENDCWRGFHVCICGEWSGNKDLMLQSGHITNSLAIHYLKWHRQDIPESEIDKLKKL